MAPDLERHGTGILERLHDHSDDSDLPAVAAYLSEHDLPVKDGLVLVEYLAGRGLVRNWSTHDGPDADITAQGIAWVQQIRSERDNPARRIGTLRTRMLLWLDKHEQQEIDTLDWSGFLSGPDADYYGTSFTKQDLAREAGYLTQHNLITAIATWQVSPGMIRPRLTASGRDCVIDFGGKRVRPPQPRPAPRKHHQR